MSIATVFARASLALDAPLVHVEVHISNGLPGFTIVGLAQNALKEAKEWVRSAIIKSQFQWPTRLITINLAPAELPNGRGGFDLAIAIGILVASKQLQGTDLAQYEFVGELALSGELRSIEGILPLAYVSGKSSRSLVVPRSAFQQIFMVVDLSIYGGDDLGGCPFKREEIIDENENHITCSSRK